MILQYISRFLIVGICTALPFLSQAQKKIKQAVLLPVDIAPALAANFAELRPNHFHGGLDFKVMGVVGKNLIAIDTGYISRIAIRPSGYGRVAYITHPNGLTSVYAHMHGFSPRIDSILKAYQYKHEIHNFDVKFGPNDMPVSRGEVFGYAGNSGSSTGPHLHFEIRNTVTENQYNPLFYYPQLVDKARPKISKVALYVADTNSFINNKRDTYIVPVVPVGGQGLFKVSKPISVSGNIAFGINGLDYWQGVPHTFGYYSVVLECNNTILYSRKIDELPLTNIKDFNSFIDYREFIKTRFYFEKTMIDKNNEFKFYETLHNNGVLQVVSDTSYCRFIVGDYNDNKASVDFVLVNKPITDSARALLKKIPSPKQKHNCLQPFDFTLEGFTYSVNNKTFFNDYSIELKVETPKNPAKYYSKVYSVKTDQITFKGKAKVSIPTTLPKDLYDKAVVEVVQGNDRRIAKTKIDARGFAKAEVNKNASFAVVVDTVAPRIATSIKPGANLVNVGAITFTMGDNLSGVEDYNAYIDNQWVILDYDAKARKVFLWFKDAKYEPNKMHDLRIVVSDECGNTQELSTTFFK